MFIRWKELIICIEHFRHFHCSIKAAPFLKQTIRNFKFSDAFVDDVPILFTLATTPFGLIFFAVLVEELCHSLVISIKYIFYRQVDTC